MTIDWLSKKNPLLVKAAKAERKFHPALTVLFYVVMYLLSFRLTAFIQWLYSKLGLPPEYSSIAYDVAQTAVIVIFCFFVVKIEKRSLRSIGFARRGVLIGMLKGMGVCLIMLGVIVGFLTITGHTEFTGFNPSFSLGVSSMFFGGYAIQALSEEVASRGYLLISLANRMNVIWAILLQSLIFTALHIETNGLEIFPLSSIFLLGIILSVYFLRTGDLWGATGFHLFQNWAYGNMFNLYTGESWGKALLQFKIDPAWDVYFMNGGYQLIYVIVILALIFWPKKDNKSCGDLVS